VTETQSTLAGATSISHNPLVSITSDTTTLQWVNEEVHISIMLQFSSTHISSVAET
jgi:hypothetical protein